MLDLITPVIIAQDEVPNMARTLTGLTWAESVIVVDGGSQDDTIAVAESFPNVRVVTRPFTALAEQWTFALEQANTPWVLRLDADYSVPASFVEEVSQLKPADTVAGYEAAFVYCIYGRPLRASLYPPKAVLLRQGQWQCYQDGHTEAWRLTGEVASLKTKIAHDDHKSMTHWFRSQSRYLKNEKDKLLAADPAQLDRSDRIRLKRIFAPFLVFFYCLFCKGLILDGRAGLYYCFQRTLAELLLSLYLLEGDLKPAPKETTISS